MAIEEAYVVITLSRATDSVQCFPFANKRAAQEAVTFVTRDVGIEAMIIDDHDEPDSSGGGVLIPADAEI